jgi:hypothetical protein
MAATTGLDKYLKEGRPLRLLQFEPMYLTVSLLQTFLNIWKSQYGGSMITKRKGPKNTQALPVHVNREKRNSAAVILARL